MLPDSHWYYATDGRQQGPVSTDALRDLLASGKLKASDLVWCEGMADWSAAASVAALVPAVLPPPMVAVPVSPPPPATYGAAPDPRAYGARPIPYYPSGQSYNALAIVGFVLALTPLGLIGLILSLIALNGMKNSGNYEGHGLAKAGMIIPLVCMSAALIFGCLWFTLFATVLGMAGRG